MILEKGQLSHMLSEAFAGENTGSDMVYVWFTYEDFKYYNCSLHIVCIQGSYHYNMSLLILLS